MSDLAFKSCAICGVEFIPGNPARGDLQKTCSRACRRRYEKEHPGENKNCPRCGSAKPPRRVFCFECSSPQAKARIRRMEEALGPKHEYGSKAKCSDCGEFKFFHEVARLSHRRSELGVLCLSCRDARQNSGEKFCGNCRRWLPDENFPRSGSKRRSGTCRPCRSLSGRDVEYDGSFYDSEIVNQDHKCLICGIDESDTRGKRLVVDHDHNTGLPRFVLCFKCNSGLGFFRDSPILMRRAADLIEEHERSTSSV